jgi:hypothetical protein
MGGSLIPFLAINIGHFGPLPIALLAHDLEYGLFAICGIEVDAAKVVPVIFHFAVLVSPTRKVEANPGVDLMFLTQDPGAIVFINLYDLTLLYVIGSELVVENGIPVEADSGLLGRLAKLKQFGFGSPFGSNGSLLIKLAKIVQVVYVVSIPVPRRSFASNSRKDSHQQSQWSEGAERSLNE